MFVFLKGTLLVWSTRPKLSVLASFMCLPEAPESGDCQVLGKEQHGRGLAGSSPTLRRTKPKILDFVNIKVLATIPAIR